jgi:hypothetical protein
MQSKETMQQQLVVPADKGKMQQLFFCAVHKEIKPQQLAVQLSRIRSGNCSLKA